MAQQFAVRFVAPPVGASPIARPLVTIPMIKTPVVNATGRMVNARLVLAGRMMRERTRIPDAPPGRGPGRGLFPPPLPPDPSLGLAFHRIFVAASMINPVMTTRTALTGILWTHLAPSQPPRTPVGAMHAASESAYMVDWPC